MDKHFNAEQFAEDVRVKRAKLNISMQEVADIVGVSKPTISRASAGKMPEVYTYYGLCKWLGVPMEHYFINIKRKTNDTNSKTSN